MYYEKNYIVCLLDIKRDREQCGLFFLTTSAGMSKISEIFSVPALKKLLGDRWELHVNEIEATDDDHKFASTEVTVAGCAKRIIQHLKKKEQSDGSSYTILLPANVPTKR